MVHDNFFLIFGQIVFIIAIALLIILIISLILGVILVKKQKLIFPKMVIFTLDFLYSPLKKLASLLGFDEIMVDQIGVEIRNHINKKEFKEIDNAKKIIVFPHCLRHPKCHAKLEKTGLDCNVCGLCAIGEIKPKAEEMGYKSFIIPGSTFIKKIVENYEFESVLGIACYEDLNMSMMKLSKFKPQGVLLSRTGCYNTEVDVQTVLKKIGYINEKTNTKNSGCSKDNLNNPSKNL
ncbi:MAG: DUF116 domain-containing protein [Methanobrevibacter sp.]|jgi:hypothetical protein|nr:DUF116 domain-containing protein [Candidatus Methanoflexus mossambicus]